MKKYIYMLLKPHKKQDFILSLPNWRMTVLDIGCGNNSPRKYKRLRNNDHYIGIDVNDYNLSSKAKSNADEYYLVKPNDFVNKIKEYSGKIDVIISSHNIEHCNNPKETLLAMVDSLKKGGYMYFSFPCEESVNFPSRMGTLNFYDDPTHQHLPTKNEILTILEDKDMTVVYYNTNYSPIIMKIIVMILEPLSFISHRVLPGTWEWYGFETIIWARKKT